MIKKFLLTVLVVSMALSLATPVLVQAESRLTVHDSSVQINFPHNIAFYLSAGSNLDIVDVRLHYSVDRKSFAQVTSEVRVEVVPDTDVDVQWVWDMRRTGGLPPGAIVRYWWELTDVEGNQLVTVPSVVHFDDDRYQWQSIATDDIKIYWYESEQSFAEELMTATQQALAQLLENTGVYLSEPVTLYIYRDSEDLLGSMIFPKEWTGGVAFPAFGIVVLGISPFNLEWGKGAIIHEVTHLVVQQIMSNPYNDLPRWLDEGLAMYAEGELEQTFIQSIKNAVAGDNLFSVRTLNSPFSVFAAESYLSYAQSFSIVDFLITGYGQDKLLDLLRTFKEGSGYDQALMEVYGFGTDELDALWSSYAVKKYS